MLKPHEKTIKDSKGEEHVYKTIEFPGEEAIDFALELAQIASAGFSKLGPALQGEQGAPNGEDVDAKQLLALGQAVEAAAAAAVQKGGTKLIKRLLKYTLRDDEQFNPAKGKFDLNETYRGNLGELLGAVIFVIGVNFSSFFCSLDVVSAVKTAREAMGGETDSDPALAEP